MDMEKQGLSLSYLFFVLAICIIISISISSYTRFQTLIQTGNWVEHTYQVLITTLQISDSVAYIESRQRAYLLFNDKDFSTEYEKTRHNINIHLNELKKLVADNPVQKQRTEFIQSLVEKRLSILKDLIYFKTSNKLNTQEAFLIFNEGRLLSTQLRQNIMQLIAEENRLLTIRDKIIEDEINSYNIYLFIGEGLSILFLIFAFLILRKNKKQISSMQNQLWGIVNSAKDIIVAIDDQMRFLLFNKAFKDEFFKLFHKEVSPGMRLEDALGVSSNQGNKVYDLWKESFAASKPFSKVFELKINNEPVTYEIYSNKIYDNGKLLAAVHITRNISERVKEKAELELANQRLQETMNELSDRNSKISLLLEMSDVMLATNSLKELSSVTTKYAAKILTFTNGCVYVMHPSKNLLESSSVWGEPRSTVVYFEPDECWALRLGKIHYVSKDVNMTCGHINSNVFYLCAPLRAQSDIFGVLYIEFNTNDESIILSKNNKLIIGAFAEITALALANVSLRESLKYQSIRDPLTSLYNRRYLEEFLYKQICQAERNHQPISVLMLDVDHFKRINDIHGHDAGDLVLKEFSTLLVKEIRPGDIVARYGGEEFVVVFYNTKLEDALVRANNIRKKTALLTLTYGTNKIGITVSIGVSSYPECGLNSKSLIESADKALYAAKNSGRDRVVSFEQNKSSTHNVHA